MNSIQHSFTLKGGQPCTADLTAERETNGDLCVRIVSIKDDVTGDIITDSFTSSEKAGIIHDAFIENEEYLSTVR